MGSVVEKRLPEWLRKPVRPSKHIHGVKRALRARGLHTVCEEARCPNIGECLGRGTATIMIMGDTCTRDCRFCAVKGGVPAPLDPDEPKRVAEQVRDMGLRHAVITSVTRDDLPDGGAAFFVRTIEAIRELCPDTAVEVLTPDFKGREEDIRTVCEAGPHVYNHNVETVERLTPQVRDRAQYRRSLSVLSAAGRALAGQGRVKSGLMVGLGESDDEVAGALKDLAGAGCDIVTVGQYLAPSKASIPVARYVDPEKFQEYKETGLRYGIKFVFSGPFVRSSYMADKVLL